MVGIQRRKVNWILDADYRSFFDAVSHDWLIRFLRHRIGDERILRLIRKWLKAGVFEEGIVTESEAGTPQGATASPCWPMLLALRVRPLGAAVAETHARGHDRRPLC